MLNDKLLKEQLEAITKNKCVITADTKSKPHGHFSRTDYRTVTISNWNLLDSTERILVDLNFKGWDSVIVDGVCTLTISRKFTSDNELAFRTHQVIKRFV